MKNMVKDNWLLLLVAAALIIGGALTEPLVAVLGILIGVFCALAAGIEKYTSRKAVQELPAAEKECRNYSAQVSYSTY